MRRTESVLTLRQISLLLPRFGLHYEERALRYALRGVGVEPVAHVPNVSTGKGRVLLYDALTPMVLTSAYQSQLGGPLRDLGRPLAGYRQLAETKVSTPQMGVERAAGYLFITSSEYGLDTPRLAALLDGSPRLEEILPEDARLYPGVLRGYQQARAGWEAGIDLFAGLEKFAEPMKDPLVRSMMQVLADPMDTGEKPREAETNRDNVIGERFSISEYFDGSWSPSE